MYSISQCYDILELPSNASLFEIKKAFRAKAKILHPDKCSDADAGAKFIQLTQAYEILINYKARGITSSDFFKRNHSVRKEQEAAKQAEAQRKAKHAARMKYEQFLQSDYFKTNLYADILIDHFVFLLSFFAIIILPVLLIREMGTFGFVPWIIILIFTAPFTFNPLFNLDKLSLKNLFTALKYIGVKKEIAGFLTLTGSILIFFLILFRTLISGEIYLMTLLLVIAGAYAFCKYYSNNKYSKRSLLISLTIAPFLFNCIFLLNYFVSFASKTETYKYEFETYSGRKKGGGKDTFATVIRLSNDEYEPFGLLRTFYGQELNGNTVKLEIARGIFGMRVVKSFEFYYEK